MTGPPKGHRVEIVGVGRVALEAGTNLLQGLKRAGFEIMATCAGEGTCGTCRVRLLKGLDEPTPAHFGPLAARFRDQGWVLACQVSVEQDLTIELDGRLMRSWPAGLEVRAEPVQSAPVTPAAPSPTVRRLVLDPLRCTGCNGCILGCSFQHERSFSFARSRIRVEHNEATHEPKVCIQCDEAPCIEVCPVDALSRAEPGGAIGLDAKACIGCELCVSACPYDGVQFDRQARLPLICDLCGGRPACVEACHFPEALRFESALALEEAEDVRA